MIPLVVLHPLPWPMWVIAAGDVWLLGWCAQAWAHDRLTERRARSMNVPSQDEGRLGRKAVTHTGGTDGCSNEEEGVCSGARFQGAQAAEGFRDGDHRGDRLVQPADGRRADHRQHDHGGPRRDQRAVAQPFGEVTAATNAGLDGD